jgi:hypothetical protein
MSQSYQRHHDPRDRNLRAADSDRESVADLLREQHLAGRLGSDEFQERLDRCYAARTYGELDELVADLPREEPRRPAASTWRRPAMALLPLLLIAAIVLSHGHLLWLLVPAFFFIYRPLRWRYGGGGPTRCGVHGPRSDSHI